MCELLGLSSCTETHISLSLHEFSRHGGLTNHHADGWGLATYKEMQAKLYREAAPAAFSNTLKCLESNHPATLCAIAHIRHATQGGVALKNTQPFERNFQGRSHVFAHNGDLQDIKKAIILTSEFPHGETDSEYAFCYLMEVLSTLWEKGVPTLKERATLINKIFRQLSTLGPANILYSDGDYLYAFANKRMQTNGNIEPPGLHYLSRECGCDKDALQHVGIHIDCKPNKILLFASVPLTNENWISFTPDQLVIAKNGQIIEQG